MGSEFANTFAKKRQVIMKYLFAEVLNGYRLIMDSRLNPLSRIPDIHTRHVVMQILAWVWCLIVSLWVGSIVVFGISALVHTFLIAGVFITLAVFDTAETSPHYFRRKPPQHFGALGRGSGGEHE